MYNVYIGMGFFYLEVVKMRYFTDESATFYLMLFYGFTKRQARVIISGCNTDDERIALDEALNAKKELKYAV